MKPIRLLLLLPALLVATSAFAQVPPLVHYQGRVAVASVPFEGTGQFKFALVNADGSQSHWSNDGSSVAGAEPAAAVSLAVAKGLYDLDLGDSALSNMQALPTAVVSNADLWLRVWFSDGVNGFELLTPDQRLVSVPFALRAHSADSIPDGSVTAGKLAEGAITGSKLAAGSINLDRLAFNGTPNVGQVLGYDGANLTWVTATGGPGGGGSLTLPFNGGPIANNGALFSVNNIGATDAWAIYGHSQTNLGVFGQTHGNAQSGVLGRNDGATGADGAGVYGYASTQARGVLGISEQGTGVWGETKGANQSGVYGLTAQITSVAGRFVNNGVRANAGDPFPTAVSGDTNDGWSVYGRSQSGIGVFGQAIVGGNGVLGRNEGTSGHAVHGYSSGAAIGVRGDSVGGDGVVGTTTAAAKAGLYGYANHATSFGVTAINPLGVGVFGQTSTAGTSAAFFWNTAGGDAIRTTGHVNVGGTTTTKVLTITGGSDLAEPFPIHGGEIPKGSVVVIDEDRPGHLLRSSRAYDTRVAGVVSGANGVHPGISLQQEGVLSGGQQVALSGRVYVLADASHGAIKPGDLLTTSETPGHAMRSSDPARSQGAILGKAMTPLAEGSGYVLVLVTLQ